MTDKKLTLNVMTGFIGLICGVLFLVTGNILAFGFALLFKLMFFIDSLWYFIKNKILKNSMKPIGGEVGSTNNSINK